MAIKYLIKDTLVATENNLNFAGHTRTYWYGKEDTSTCDELDIKRLAKWYGYSTKAGAMRGLKKRKELADWEMERGFWKHASVEIVAIEV